MQIVRNWIRSHLNDPQVVVLTLSLAAIFIVIVLLGEILLPVLVSVVVAYLLEGVVKILQRCRVPRFLAVATVYLAFLTGYLLLLFGVVPLLSIQLTQALQDLPGMINRLYDGLMKLPERYTFIDPDWFARIFTNVRQGIQAELTKEPGALGMRLVVFSLSSFRGLIVLFVYLILLPILVFFMLKDKHRILAWFGRFVPRERRLATEVWQDMDYQIGNYVRGKFWEILIVGGATSIVFTWLDLNYTILLSMLVGFSVIVPYVGATVVTFPVALVAFSQWGFSPEFLWVLGMYLIIQALDGNVLVPLLFSEAVHLHPIAIIVAVLVFGGIWGFWGAFFAIPLATLVQSVLKVWPRRSQQEPQERAAGSESEAEAPSE